MPTQSSQTPMRDELVRAKEAARIFFQENPWAELHVADIGERPDGSWVFAILDVHLNTGWLNFTPPNDAFTREDFRSLMNTTEVGQRILWDYLESNGANVSVIVDETLQEDAMDHTRPTQ